MAVFPFENLSGDPELDGMGEYAAFGISDGLSRMDESQPVSQDAVRRVLQSAGEDASAREIAADLGAGTSVTGVFFSRDDTLELRAEITAVGSGEVIHTVDASGRADDPSEVVETLRQRVMGAVATMLGDDRSTLAISRPLSYQAYQAWARATERFDALDWPGFLHQCREAYRLDTTFMAPLMGMVTAYGNLGRPTDQDSILSILEHRRSELRPGNLVMLEYLHGWMSDDPERMLEALRVVVRDHDRGWWITLLGTLVNRGRPEEALQLWEDYREGRISAPRRWTSLELPPFWMALAAAQHVTGRYREELATARHARELMPDAVRLRLPEIRALVALDRWEEARSLIDEVENIEQPSSPRGWSPVLVVYWVGADMARHGHAVEARAAAERVISWLRSRDPEGSPFEMANALLLADRPAEALELAQPLVEEYPDEVWAHRLLGIALARTGDRPGAEAEARWLEELERPYLKGDHIRLRAAIVAHLGQKELAVRLLRQAIFSFRRLHYDPDYAPLWGYDPFERLIAPRG